MQSRIFSAAIWTVNAAFVSHATGGIFTTDFGSGEGLDLRGDASIGADGMLHLTDNAGGRNGTAVIVDLDPSAVVTSFSANFELFIGLGNGADGISFNFGSPFEGSIDEEGTDSGLTLRFDTYNGFSGDNGGRIEAVYNGVVIGVSGPVSMRTSRLVGVGISVNEAGMLSLSHDGVSVFSDLLIEDWAPESGWLFSLAARTGGLTDAHWIEDLSITTTAVPAPAALAPILGGGLLAVRRRRPAR